MTWTPESRQACSRQSKFTSPNDWPVHKKLAIVVASFLSVINSGIGTSLPSNAVPYIMQEFHVEDATQSNLPTSVFLIGYIVGPLAFSPLSETVGRRLVLLPTITVFTLSTVACALSPNWGSLLFFRFICGTMGSAPQTVVGGVYADMFFDLRERGRVMAFYMASASFGPILGPIISGFASPSYGWRWTFWIASILAGCAWICLLFVPETFGPVLSRRNAPGLGDTVPKNTVNVVQIVKRPLAMLLFEPIITFTSIYIALAYGLVFFYFQAYPIIFDGVYGFDVQTTSLAFLPVGVGAASTSLVALYWDMTYDKAKKHNKPWRFGAELHRLPISCLGAVLLTASSFWLAWTSRSAVHWAVPIASGVVFGFGYQTIFVSLLTYVTDAYKIYSASALASSVILRSVLGALLPLAAKPMYETLGQAVAVIIPEEVPPIHTERLLLRPLRIDNDEDAAGIFSIRSRQDVVDWLWPRVADTTVEETKAHMMKKVFKDPDAAGAVGRLFFFVIIPKNEPDRIIGSLGVNSLSPAPSVGYAMHPSYWGRGYASEALRGVIDAWWKLPRVDGLGHEEKLFAAVNIANKGSVKVLQRNGFKIYKEVVLEGDTVACMELESACRAIP
ncbi:hypothetical protein KXV44_001859 [Aspergillus fumigatus]|nr:hypothetical protein KXX42_002270 [Aspergillus fumigatus]KAH2413487.1 hypothetical protein KXV44_001859 [Aspergillus fumigatus]KAH3201435.1 hypothetical protein KXW62_008947 [Aspergillus fumigatus]KAH3273083.1 hypothetical protein KXW55_008973 [Aspergillus fumigatus]KAH3303415.1 hypothetical protein KXV87_001907 [Aspergillus fumigatus]